MEEIRDAVRMDEKAESIKRQIGSMAQEIRERRGRDCEGCGKHIPARPSPGGTHRCLPSLCQQLLGLGRNPRQDLEPLLQGSLSKSQQLHRNLQRPACWATCSTGHTKAFTSSRDRLYCHLQLDKVKPLVQSHITDK